MSELGGGTSFLYWELAAERREEGRGVTQQVGEFLKKKKKEVTSGKGRGSSPADCSLAKRENRARTLNNKGSPPTRGKKGSKSCLVRGLGKKKENRSILLERKRLLFPIVSNEDSS